MLLLLLLSLLLLLLLLLGLGPGRVWDLRVLKLDSSSCSEPLSGINWVLLLDLIVVSSYKLSLTSFWFSSGVAWQTTDVGELTLATIGVNVSVLSSGDAVHSSGLLSERSILSNVTKGEAAVGVVVGVVVGGLDRFFPGLAWDTLSFLSFFFSGGFKTGSGFSATWHVWGTSSASTDFGRGGSWSRDGAGSWAGNWFKDWLFNWCRFLFWEKLLRDLFYFLL